MRRRSKLLRRSTFNDDFDVRTDMFSQNEPGSWIDPTLLDSRRLWRRNLLTYSDQFSNSAWSKNNATITPNTHVAPDGTMTADTMADDATLGTHYIRHGSFSTNTEGNKLCRSYYVKKGTARYIAILPIDNISSTVNSLTFDFDTGAYVNTPPQTLYIDGYDAPVNVGDGWWRLSFWSDTGAAGYGRGCVIAILNGSNIATAGSYSGSGSTVIIWGFQMENGVTSPTAYQPITDFSTEFKDQFRTHELYQDWTGVAPVTAPGDLVGLVISKSHGGLSNLGAELIPDPTLTSTTGWVLDAGWSASGGDLLGNNAAAGSQIFASSPEILTQNRVYLIEVTVTAYSGTGGLRIDARPTSGGTGSTTHATITATGTHRTILVNTGANTRVCLRLPSNVAAQTVTVSSVSVKEIPGGHAYQSTSGSRMSLARVPVGGRRNMITRSEEFDVSATWTNAGTSPTITANQIANPLNGEITADLITMPDVSQTRIQHTGMSLQPNTTYTASLYVKNNTMTAGQTFGLVVNNFLLEPNSAYPGVSVSLANGTVANYSGGSGISGTPTVGIIPLANGWYRVYVTFTLGAITGVTTGGMQIIRNFNAASFYAFGAQLEVGQLSNYQKTTIAGTVVDVTEAGVQDCWYLDTTSNKWMLTNPIEFGSWTGNTARRNRLINSSKFGAWTLQSATVTENSDIGPSGEQNADTLINGGVGSSGIYQDVLLFSFSTQYTFSCWLKAGTSTNCVIGVLMNGGWLTCVGSVIGGAAIGGVTGNPTNISGLTSSWTRIQLVFTTASAGVPRIHIYPETSGVGTGKTVIIADAQLELGAAATEYQEPGTDEMTLVVGARKIDDANQRMVLELGTGGQNGSIYIGAPIPGSDTNVRLQSRGTADAFKLVSGHPQPKTMVLGGFAKIGTDICNIRVNGVEGSNSSTDQGFGNFGNYPLYIGSRAGSSLFFTGPIFQAIARGKSTSTSLLASCEKFVAAKSGITI